jgi:hypothetical protein
VRKPGFIIDVPVTLRVAVRGATEEEAKQIARDFAEALQPSDHYIGGYCQTAKVTITEVTLGVCEFIDCDAEPEPAAVEKLEADDEDEDGDGDEDDEELCECGREPSRCTFEDNHNCHHDKDDGCDCRYV